MHHSSRLSPFLSLVLCGLFFVSAACTPVVPAAPTALPVAPSATPIPTQPATAAPTQTQPAATATTAPTRPAPTATQPTPTLAPTATQPKSQPPVATVAGSFPLGNFKNEKLGIILTFIADGKFSITTPENANFADPGTEPGTYTIAGNQITIEQQFVQCKGVKGTYSWTYDGKALKFKSFGDKCSTREFNMEGLGPYANQSTAQPPAATVAGAFPIGSFKNEKNGIVMTFLADGNFNEVDPLLDTAFGSYGGVIPGIYTMAGNQITIEQVDQCQSVKGTYSWTYDGKALKFKSLGDKCAIREFNMEFGPYVMQP